MYQALKFFPGKILGFDGDTVGVMLFGAAGLLWALVPIWDTRLPSGSRNRIITYIGVVVLLSVIVLTWIGLK